MSVFRTSTIGDFTRGGQTTLHFLRMIGQVVRKFGSFIVVCFVLWQVFYFFSNTTSYERYVMVKWAAVKVSVETFKDGNSKTPFNLVDGRTVSVSKKAVLADQYIQLTIDHSLHVLVRGLLWGIAILLCTVTLIIWFIYRTGFSLRQETFLRGTEILDAAKLKAFMRKAKKDSDLNVAGIPLLRDSETSHILFTGSPGSGKSLAMKDLLDVIRKRGDRAIIYSTAGEFIENYYRDGKDVILNPLDARCPSWNVWCEAHTPPDFDNIAASLIPESGNSADPFWVLAARTIFSTMALRLKDKEHSTARLLQDLLAIKLEEAAKLLEGTEGAAIIAEGAEKTALSVRATLASNIRSLKFLKDKGEQFSIKDWVAEDKGDSWVFISSRPDQKETLRPLITTWLDIATAAILSLPESRTRRIWLIIDELPSLNKLPTLEEMIAQSRKFGGCCVLGFQSYAQLAKIYGQTGAEALTGLCSTWICYRANEPKTAKWASEAFGAQEMMETSEGLSYGANEIRDGLSLSMARKMRPLVLPTEMMNLPDLFGYIRLPGEFPIGKFTLKYKPREETAKAFIAGDFSDTAFDFSVQDVPEIKQSSTDIANELAAENDQVVGNQEPPEPATTEDLFRNLD